MPNMEFLSDNLYDTSAVIVLDSGTDTADNLFDRNYGTFYETVGYSSNTSCIISIEFSTPTVISHLILKNHNFKQYRAFYDSVTANVFSVDVNVSSSSASSSYHAFDSITVSSVQLQMDAAFDADTEKKIGQFIVAERKLAFAINPPANNYKPMISKKQIRHVMPDGGITLYNIKDKYKAKIGLKFITSAFRNNLEDVYEDSEPLYFVPFPTTTSWDGKVYPVVWSGNFDFKPVNDVKTAYSGNINLEERSST